MPNLRSLYKTDQTKEEEGVWIDFGNGIKLRIARLGNPKYNAYLRRIGKPHQMSIRNGSASQATVEDLTIRAIAKHVLLGWEGVDEDNELVPYTEEKALEYLRTMRDFYQQVLELSSDANQFREEELKEEEGNSDDGSDG